MGNRERTERGVAWLQDRVPFLRRLRYRALAVVLAVTLAAISVLTMSTLPAWPVIGVAVATVALALNTVASRLSEPVCHGCGGALKDAAYGPHGTVCPGCGAINLPMSGRA